MELFIKDGRVLLSNRNLHKLVISNLTRVMDLKPLGMTGKSSSLENIRKIIL